MLTTFAVIMSDKTRLTIEISESLVIAAVKGTEPAIADIGQQLAWMAAAFRPSASDDRISYSQPLIEMSPGTLAIFKVSFQVAEMRVEESQKNGSCWHSLFRNPVIVAGYPTLARENGEKGLEIPLNMMAGLSHASRVTNFGDGLVIKGHSTMFCPTKRIKNSVIWHYLFNPDATRMSYCSADILCPARARIHQVDSGCLGESRHFLGWASSVEVHIGKSSFKTFLLFPDADN